MGLQKKSEDITIRLRFVPHYCSDLDCHLEHFSPTPSTHSIFFCRTEKSHARGLVQLGEYLHKRCPGFHLKQPASQICCCAQQVRGGSRRIKSSKSFLATQGIQGQPGICDSISNYCCCCYYYWWWWWWRWFSCITPSSSTKLCILGISRRIQ